MTFEAWYEIYASRSSAIGRSVESKLIMRDCWNEAVDAVYRQIEEDIVGRLHSRPERLAEKIRATILKVRLAPVA